MSHDHYGDDHDCLLGWEVEAHYATRPHHRVAGGRGKVVAYCDAPQVLIETPDGEKMWWRADMVRRIERRRHA